MSEEHRSADPYWWYGVVALVLIAISYYQLTPPDASILSVVLSAFFILSVSFCTFMDIKEIRRTDSPWSPRTGYVAGAFFTPILFVYVYRRYRHVGLVGI